MHVIIEGTLNNRFLVIAISYASPKRCSALSSAGRAPEDSRGIPDMLRSGQYRYNSINILM